MEANKPSKPSAMARLLAFVDKNYFVVGMIVVILLAAAHPFAGSKNGPLEPKILCGWVVVCIIFFLSGWSLKTQELVKAATHCKLNSFVQIFSLGVIPVVVFGITRLIKSTTSMSVDLLNGLVITASLPTTVSMCVVLTTTAGGNVSAAIFNAASGNLLGVVITPLMILVLLGSETSIDIAAVVSKLALKMVLPLALGQILQYNEKARKWYTARKKNFKRAQETMLLLIVYTTFCETFFNKLEASAGAVLAVLGLLVAMYFLWLGLLGKLCQWLGFCRADCVTAMFCGSHKTVAAGIPLLNTMFEGDPRLGLFVVPLLVWHPLQLFVGSFLAPSLKAWVAETAPKETEPATAAAPAAAGVELAQVTVEAAA
jgi:sodium/bile acid cotransporter 7